MKWFSKKKIFLEGQTRPFRMFITTVTTTMTNRESGRQIFMRSLTQ